MAMKLIFSLALAILLIASISADIEFFQYKQDLGNGTIKNHLFLMYSKGGSGDYVSGNNQYEVYILYNIYPKTWNSQNPSAMVEYCNFRVFQSKGISGENIILLDKNYTDLDSDIMSDKYFIRMDDGDSFEADQTCYFQNNSFSELYLPAEEQILTPTWECKECQYYEWSLVERGAEKTQIIGGYVSIISGYIEKLISLNFEIVLALFWFFLILMVLVGISFIFIGMFWIYKYMKHLIK